MPENKKPPEGMAARPPLSPLKESGSVRPQPVPPALRVTEPSPAGPRPPAPPERRASRTAGSSSRGGDTPHPLNGDDGQATTVVPRIPSPQKGGGRSGGGKKPPPGKRRPMTGCLTGILYFLVVVGVSAMLAGFGWQCARDVLGLMKTGSDHTVVVPDEFTLYDVSEKLGEMGLIEHPWLFRIYGRLSNAEAKITPGTYSLKSSLDYRAMVNGMTERSELRETVRVSIPEGLTMEQVFALLQEKAVSTAEKLRDTMRDHDFEHELIRGLPKTDNRLEGYLYPDTYDFYINENPVSALSKQLSNFHRKMSRDFRERIGEMGEQLELGMEMTMTSLLAVASMVQNEAANEEEMPKIASVIYNRLRSDSFPRLEIDATLVYLIGRRAGHEITSAEIAAAKEIDSPYNTYMYEGLPPGPISSPGLTAIRAALYPEETGYYFYALTDEGVHKFSKTLTEHNKVVADNQKTAGNG